MFVESLIVIQINPLFSDGSTIQINTICEQQSSKDQTIKYYKNYINLLYDVASGSKITPCNKIDKPLVVYRFLGNVMTSLSTFRTQ